MDVVHQHGNTTFIWDQEKADQNARKHGVRFEEAVTVFDDPLFVLVDASRKDESRHGVIGFSAVGRLLLVIHLDFDGDAIRLISARRATTAEEELYAQ